MKPEQLLAKRVSNHMLTKYPNVPFRFDSAADVPLPPHVARALHALHGKWSTGYVDMLIAHGRGGYGGLMIELKATETVPDTKHTRNQARVHAILRHNGFKVTFACGLKQTKKIIKKYMKLNKNKLSTL